MAEHTQALQPRKIRALHPEVGRIVDATLYPEHFGDKDAIRFMDHGDYNWPYHLADDIAWEEI